MYKDGQWKQFSHRKTTIQTIAATHSLAHNKVKETLEAKIEPIHFLWEIKGVAAIFQSGPMVNFFI